MNIDDELAAFAALQEESEPLKTGELFNDTVAFEAWMKRFLLHVKDVPFVQAQEIKTYAFVCQKEMTLNALSNSLDNGLDNVKTLCGNIVRYCIWNDQVYSPFYAVDSEKSLDYKDLVSTIYSPTLYNRIQFYLLDNGYVMCDRCGTVYKVV